MSDEEYEFEYSDEDEEMQQDDVAVQIENEYYVSKGSLDGDVGAAAAGFKRVLQLEGTKADGSLAEWGFKATKQLVKLSCRQGNYEQMLTFYGDLLKRVKAGAVTRNRAEKTINGILDLVSSGADSSHFSSFYDTTLEALQQGGGNDRLAFKTRTKQARLYLAQKDWGKLRPLLVTLQATCSSSPDPSSSSSAAAPDYATQLLEVYALHIQMATELRDMKRVGEFVAKASSMRSAVPHPGITGVLKEAMGKVAMRERAWEDARLAFADAFKAYEEAGNGLRTTTNLQYMLLANMLSNNRINPFDDQSSKAYERDPAIASMVALTDAYLAGDISAFEPVLRAASGGGDGGGVGRGGGVGTTRHGGGVSSHAPPQPHGGLDEFMLGYVNDLLSTMRTSVVLSTVTPYDRVRLSWLGREIGVSAEEAESLVAGLILDGRLVGSIDQPAGVVNLSAGHLAAHPPSMAGGRAGQGAEGGGGARPGKPRKDGGGGGKAQDSGAMNAAYAELTTLATRLEQLLAASIAANGGASKESSALRFSLGFGSMLDD